MDCGERGKGWSVGDVNRDNRSCRWETHEDELPLLTFISSETNSDIFLSRHLGSRSWSGMT